MPKDVFWFIGKFDLKISMKAFADELACLQNKHSPVKRMRKD